MIEVTINLYYLFLAGISGSYYVVPFWNQLCQKTPNGANKNFVGVSMVYIKMKNLTIM